MTNLAKFKDSIDRQMKAIEQQAIDKQRAIASSLLNRVIDNTPRFTGFLASNIMVSLNGVFFTTPDEFQRDPNKRGQFFENIETNRTNNLAKLKLDKLSEVITVGTSVSYALEVETGGLPTVSGNVPMFGNAVQSIRAEFNLQQGAGPGSVPEAQQ